MLKHATSSVFVFAAFADAWRLGVIEHPRLQRWMIPGGHVEAPENQAEAAVREVWEETGRPVRLLAPPAAGVPGGFPRALMPMPWWITEQPVPADSHLPVRHVHLDHQYVAIAESLQAVGRAEHPFRWAGIEELASLEMFEDTRLLASQLFPLIGGVSAGAVCGAEVLSWLDPTIAAAPEGTGSAE